MIDIAGRIQYCMCPVGRRKKREWLALPAELPPLVDRHGRPMAESPADRRARLYYEQLEPTLPDAEDLQPVFLVGDAREVLRGIPDGCIDCCISSPPYLGHRLFSRRGIGREPTAEDYVKHLAAVFAEIRRVLTPGGSCWLNLGDAYRKKGLELLPARTAMSIWILDSGTAGLLDLFRKMAGRAIALNAQGPRNGKRIFGCRIIKRTHVP